MNLKSEELYGKCQTCGATGKYKTQGGEDSLRRTVLDGNCPDCGGKGINLTETGEIFKEFIKALKDRGFF